MKTIKILVIDPDTKPQRRELEILGQKYEVEFAISVYAVENISNLKEKDGGLDYYHYIFFEMMIDGKPYFGLSETNDYLNTGYFLYKKFLEKLKSTTILWTYTNDYSQFYYPNQSHPDRSWGSNLKFLPKEVGKPNSLVNFVDNHLQYINERQSHCM